MTISSSQGRRASHLAPQSSPPGAFQVSPADDPEGGARRRNKSGQASPPAREDLAFTLEVWDETETTLETVLAVTSNPAVGYAMFHAAIQHYSGARIILRRKGLVISRWSGVTH